ncbi:flavin reductase family protein [Christensenella tenuis]|uniref:Flavin reductase family protein n=1 Tax=Christensenella tenuis TaxID=2763033 RepID=A0ABR7EEC9_9FIRM|nr:flavin reductase family protein [Christensenella tenuis]MBC5647706.1 flavin reductase family protein [Christensenella tenuis]
MKKDLGPVLGLYPTPLVVVGALIGDKPNWVLAGHTGIMGHDRIMVSLAKTHYTNRGIRKTKTLSVNIVDEAMLEKADYVGCVSGNETDKSEVFDFSIGQNTAPLVNEAKISMECSVVDNYETEAFDNFILEIEHTYAEEKILSETGKIDYEKFKPVLFEMPGYAYLQTGKTIAKCMTLGRNKSNKGRKE